MNWLKYFVLGVFLVSNPAHADEEDRLPAEALSLFEAIMTNEPHPARCQYDLDWLTMAVPDYVASKYLGLTIHADLSAPQQTTNFQKTIDPGKTHAEAFCSEKDRRAYEEAQFVAFDNDKGAKDIAIKTTGFTLLIFDASYSKAIVVVSYSKIERSRRDFVRGPFKPGTVMRYPGEGVELACIYGRTDQGWKLIDRVVISQS